MTITNTNSGHFFADCMSIFHKTVVEFPVPPQSWVGDGMYFFLQCLISGSDRHFGTLYNVLLRIARKLLETKENVKIWTHPVYHTNLD